MSKPKLEWAPRPVRYDRFNDGRPLLLNGEKIGAYFQHEEDGSIAAIDEVLTALADAEVIEYSPLYREGTNTGGER